MMDSFAVCELCQDNGPFYCCFSVCDTCAVSYCVACWNRWIDLSYHQQQQHRTSKSTSLYVVKCPHCRTPLLESTVEALLGRPLLTQTKQKHETNQGNEEEGVEEESSSLVTARRSWNIVINEQDEEVVEDSLFVDIPATTDSSSTTATSMLDTTAMTREQPQSRHEQQQQQQQHPIRCPCCRELLVMERRQDINIVGLFNSNMQSCRQCGTCVCSQCGSNNMHNPNQYSCCCPPGRTNFQDWQSSPEPEYIEEDEDRSHPQESFERVCSILEENSRMQNDFNVTTTTTQFISPQPAETSASTTSTFWVQKSPPSPGRVRKFWAPWAKRKIYSQKHTCYSD